MIPTIKDICRQLASGLISETKAIAWLEQRMENADLRDQFATAALTHKFSNMILAKDIAENAYRLADAMMVLARRSKND